MKPDNWRDEIVASGRAWLHDVRNDYYSWEIERQDYGPDNPNTGKLSLNVSVQIAGERMDFFLSENDSSLVSLGRFAESLLSVLAQFKATVEGKRPGAR